MLNVTVIDAGNNSRMSYPSLEALWADVRRVVSDKHPRHGLEK